MYRDLYHYEEKIRAIIAIRICGVALWSVVLLYSLFKFVYFVLDYWNLPIGLDYSTSQVLYLWVIICGHSINKGFVFIENDFSENYIVLVLNSILTPSRNILNLMMMIFLNFFILNSLVKSVLYDGEAITMTSFEILTYSILFTANFCTNFRNFDWPVVKVI